ncbi:MAG: hypothetical protein B7Y39_09395 [Bdellovibrio sp. 28-41-41]|nr:MAG: hypothetical protein B7Y39_09395 [Bdellovibrio sp. 28-41-41]
MLNQSLISYLLVSILVSVSVWAKKPEPAFGETLKLGSASGPIQLINDKKQTKVISSLDSAMVAFKSPPFFKNIGRSLSGDKMLAIKIGDDQFNFFVPRKSIDARGEFRVHQKYTGQSYNIQYTKGIKDHSYKTREQNIECSWETADTRPQYSTDSDGNISVTYVTDYTTHWGRQQAVVEDQAWNEKQIVQIYLEKNQLNAETGYLPKTSRRVVRELTTCR